MTPKQFQAFVRRDGGCVHCGVVDSAVPHHRANRGSGGFKAGNRVSNVLVMCSLINGLMESDAAWAGLAREYGWKVSRYEQPDQVAVWYPLEGRWWFLSDGFERLDTPEK